MEKARINSRFLTRGLERCHRRASHVFAAISLSAAARMIEAICELDEPHQTFTEILTIQFCPFTNVGGCYGVLIDCELTDYAIETAVRIACIDLDPKELDYFETTFFAIGSDDE